MSRLGLVGLSAAMMVIINFIGVLAGMRALTPVEFLLAVFIVAWCNDTDGAGKQQ